MMRSLSLSDNILMEFVIWLYTAFYHLHCLILYNLIQNMHTSCYLTGYKYTFFLWRLWGNCFRGDLGLFFSVTWFFFLVVDLIMFSCVMAWTLASFLVNKRLIPADHDWMKYLMEYHCGSKRKTTLWYLLMHFDCGCDFNEL